MQRVLVLGGGFGGLEAATSLRSMLPDAEIVLIAKDHRFAMGWTKIWDLVGQRDLAVGTRELPTLREQGINVVTADISAIDGQARGVTTTAGDFEADAMIVALGAASDPVAASKLDGVFGHDLYSFEALPAAKQALAALTEGHLAVAVMGQPFKCPPAPFEAVLAIDDYLRKHGRRDAVTLSMATPSPGALPVAGPAASRTVADRVTQRDIALHLEHRLVDVDASEHLLTYDTGLVTEAALVFGVPAAVPPPVIAASDVSGDDGWIHPVPTTLATAHPRVYAVGDCTTVPTATAALPKAGVFAAGQARVAAQNVAADLGDSPGGRFDGHGHCYLEFPDREVAVVEGDFFATPQPTVTMHPASREAFDAKVAYEADTLRRWFGH